MSGITGFVKGLWQSPEQRIAAQKQREEAEFVQCRKEMSSLSTGSMGSKVVEILGGEEAFCKLPVLPWKKEFGPYRWQPSDMLGYEVDPKDMSASVMRGKNFKGDTVVILRKETTVDNYEQYSPPKHYSCITAEVLSADPAQHYELHSTKRGDYISKKVDAVDFSNLNSSCHTHINQNPPIHARDFRQKELGQLEKLLEGKTVTFTERWFNVSAKLV